MIKLIKLCKLIEIYDNCIMVPFKDGQGNWSELQFYGETVGVQITKWNDGHVENKDKHLEKTFTLDH